MGFQDMAKMVPWNTVMKTIPSIVNVAGSLLGSNGKKINHSLK